VDEQDLGTVPVEEDACAAPGHGTVVPDGSHGEVPEVPEIPIPEIPIIP
jgi:hypothetical protein